MLLHLTNDCPSAELLQFYITKLEQMLKYGLRDWNQPRSR